VSRGISPSHTQKPGFSRGCAGQGRRPYSSTAMPPMRFATVPALARKRGRVASGRSDIGELLLRSDSGRGDHHRARSHPLAVRHRPQQHVHLQGPGGRPKADRVRAGRAKPGDIPIYQATKFQLVINLRAAKALGLTIPTAVRALADEVIE
jgi:hypothetical protein